MATIQSATGPLETSEMGFTLMHEHVIVRWPPMYVSYPELFPRDERMKLAVERLTQAKAAGVKTMVDLTPIDLGRDPLFIAEAARLSGMQVIVPTGLYYQRPFYFSGRPDSDMTDLFVRDITVGIGTTGIRANVIKCATEPAMDPMNERVLRASARAHRVTGVPICTHTFPANRTGLDQQRVFKEEGVDLGRVVIGHSDDSDSIEYLEQIIDNGSFCGMDRIGLPRPRSDEQRADMVAALVAKGVRRPHHPLARRLLPHRLLPGGGAGGAAPELAPPLHFERLPGTPAGAWGEPRAVRSDDHRQPAAHLRDEPAVLGGRATR